MQQLEIRDYEESNLQPSALNHCSQTAVCKAVKKFRGTGHTLLQNWAQQ